MSHRCFAIRDKLLGQAGTQSAMSMPTVAFVGKHERDTIGGKVRSPSAERIIISEHLVSRKYIHAVLFCIFGCWSFLTSVFHNCTDSEWDAAAIYGTYCVDSGYADKLICISKPYFFSLCLHSLGSSNFVRRGSNKESTARGRGSCCSI